MVADSKPKTAHTFCESALVGTIEAPVRTALSAVTGQGVPELLDLIEKTLTIAYETIEVIIAAVDGAARAWLHQRAEVLEETHQGENVFITVRLAEKTQGQFLKQFPAARMTGSGIEERHHA